MKHGNTKCPACGSIKVVKCGKTLSGRQRYSCREESCSVKTFQLEYPSGGYWERFAPIPVPKVWRIRPFQLN